jgi:2Fe-2S ferredoxin
MATLNRSVLKTIFGGIRMGKQSDQPARWRDFMSDFEVTLLPLQTAVRARRGDTLLDAALDNGIDIPHECGGNCACTTCRVEVVAGMEHLSQMEEAERDRLSTDEEFTPACRLSCQALLLGGAVTVFLPASTESATDESATAESATETG